MRLIFLRQKPRFAGLGFKLTMWAGRNEWTVQDKGLWDTTHTRSNHERCVSRATLPAGCSRQALVRGILEPWRLATAMDVT